jgi:hypothetical protein
MRYIIIDPEEGIFLGTHGNPVPAGVRIVPLFSRQNLFEITKAASWSTKEEASAYLSRYLRSGCPKAFVAQIDSKQDFVDVIQIVKSGYGKYAEEMVDAIPMDNRSVH